MTLAWAYKDAPGVTHDKAKAAAYFRLFEALSQLTERQIDSFSAFEATLSPAEKARASEIVEQYRPMPTPLTVKALAGKRAALRLVETAAGN